MLREALVDERENFARQRIGLESGARGQAHRPFRAEGLAVVGIEIPLSAFGLAIAHQHIVALAQLAVEVLQPQRLAALGMRRELAHGGVEVAVLAHLERQAGAFGHRFQRLPHAPVARGRHHQRAAVPAFRAWPAVRRPGCHGCRRRPAACSAAPGRRHAAPRRSGASRPGTARCAACPTRHGWTPRRPRPSTPRPAWRRSRRRRRRPDRAGRPAREPVCAVQPRAARTARQASEQNLTSSQLRAQRLRQVMARPQATQGLMGNACLLPLKGAVAGFKGDRPIPGRWRRTRAPQVPAGQRPRCS